MLVIIYMQGQSPLDAVDVQFFVDEGRVDGNLSRTHNPYLKHCVLEVAALDEVHAIHGAPTVLIFQRPLSQGWPTVVVPASPADYNWYLVVSGE